MIQLFKFCLIASSLFAFCYSNPIDEPSKLDREDLFEGDIAGAKLITDSKGMAQLDNLQYTKWPGGIVAYKIENNYTQAQINVILSGMRLLENSTRINDRDCIKFVERTNEATWIRIFSENGCWSWIGRQRAAGAQDLSLKNPNCIYKGLVAHELMHALGFWHEQSRPDRDNFVTINLANVIAGQEHNFNKYTTGINTLGLAYDYYSIMHYESTAFSKNGQPTVVAKQTGVQLIPSYNKNSITQTDIDAIRKNYNCV